MIKTGGDMEASEATRARKYTVNEPLTVSCVEASYSVLLKDPDTNVPKAYKQILKKVSATFKPGHLTAIMGASGAGKTSLLNLLAGELAEGSVQEGYILINEAMVSAGDLKKVSEFVFQDDLIFDTMTVKEAIMMSAKLRVPSGISKKERMQRVNEIIRLLNLGKCQDTIIGNQTEKGISGGERKRCAIAMEMVTNPPILFLDEPTSGLDTFTAYNVMRTLGSLAHVHGRTVVCTIHQPSSEIFHLVDDLLLLADGRVAYCGEAEGAVGYFAGIGYQCPVYTNPTDYIFMRVLNESVLYGDLVDGHSTMDIEQSAGDYVSRVSPNEKIEKVLNEWQAIDTGHLVKPAHGKTADFLPVKQRASFRTQFNLLTKRAWKNLWRNKSILKARFLQSLFIAFVIGSIYRNVHKSADFEIQKMNRSGALFYLVINQFMASATAVVTIFGLEKNVFKREHDAGYYTLPAYFMSKVLVETPHQIFFPWLVMSICYYMIGFRADLGCYLKAMVGGVLCSLNGMALGTFAGALFKEVAGGITILQVIMLPLMFFSGFLVNNRSMSQSVSFLQYISPTKYAFNALMQNELQGLVFQNCNPAEPHNCSGDYVLEKMGMIGGLTIWQNYGVLLFSYLVLTLLSYGALWRLTFLK